jgi:hypothetical protein
MGRGIRHNTRTGAVDRFRPPVIEGRVEIMEAVEEGSLLLAELRAHIDAMALETIELLQEAARVNVHPTFTLDDAEYRLFAAHCSWPTGRLISKPHPTGATVLAAEGPKKGSSRRLHLLQNPFALAEPKLRRYWGNYVHSQWDDNLSEFEEENTVLASDELLIAFAQQSDAIVDHLVTKPRRRVDAARTALTAISRAQVNLIS